MATVADEHSGADPGGGAPPGNGAAAASPPGQPVASPYGPPPPPPPPGRSRGAGRGLLGLLALLIAVVLAVAVAEGVHLRRTVDTVGSGRAVPTTATSLTIPLASTVPPPTESTSTSSSAVVGTSTTTSTTMPATTTTAPVCRNSTNPACGNFRYTPNPTNRAMSANVTISADPAVAGQQITLTATYNDPDAQPDPLCSPVNWGDGTTSDAGPCPGPSPPCGGHGPFDPPPAVTSGNTQAFGLQHTYSATGSYTVVLPPERSHVPKVAEGCTDPYSSVVTAGVPVINVR